MKQRDVISKLVEELEEVVSWTETEKTSLREQELRSIREKIKLGRDALKKGQK